MRQLISTSLLCSALIVTADISARQRPTLQQILPLDPTTTSPPIKEGHEVHHAGADCAYEPDSAYLEELYNPHSITNQRVRQVTDRSLQKLLNDRSLLPAADDEGPSIEGDVRIPLAIHIVRRTDGSGGVSVASVLSAVDTLNQNFAPFNLQFDSCNIRFIDSTALFNTQLFFPSGNNVCGDPADGQRLAVGSRNLAGKINIYVAPMSTSRQAGSDGNLCTADDMFPNRSWTWRPSNATDNVLRQHIVLNSNSVTNGRTLGHEVGHWLGLLHTHGASNNRPAVGVETTELVDGSNCESTGDLVCDTPADPNLAGRVDSSCNYTGGSSLIDANGSLFQPDATNRMSYTRGSCRSNWAQGQGFRMQAGYLGVREDRGYNLRLNSCDIGFESASYVSQNAPSEMQTNSRYSVSVTFRNTGRSVWTSGYRLVSREDGFYLFNNGAVTEGIVLRRRVLPGETVSVQLEILPVSAGVFDYHWAIAKPFGQETIGSAIAGTNSKFVTCRKSCIARRQRKRSGSIRK